MREKIKTVVAKLFPKEKKKVNKIAYCLLALLVGNVGVHKFYAGKTGMGIVYILLFFVGISPILALADLAIALVKTGNGKKCIEA